MILLIAHCFLIFTNVIEKKLTKERKYSGKIPNTYLILSCFSKTCKNKKQYDNFLQTRKGDHRM